MKHIKAASLNWLFQLFRKVNIASVAELFRRGTLLPLADVSSDMILMKSFVTEFERLGSPQFFESVLIPFLRMDIIMFPLTVFPSYQKYLSGGGNRILCEFSRS